MTYGAKFCFYVNSFVFHGHMLPVMLNEAKTSRPGQSYDAEAEANFWRLRPRPRLKIIMKKVPNND